MEPWLSAAFLLLLSSLLLPLVLLARRRRSRRTPPFSLLVVAGSGGHTTEILRLLSCLSESYSPRHYVFADSDTMSEAKIRSFEQKRAETVSTSQFTLDRIPRSREVRQSWTSSVVTTLYSMLYSLPLTYRRKPDLDLPFSSKICTSDFIMGNGILYVGTASKRYFVEAKRAKVYFSISRSSGKM
ncbi:UDP-N-acetylglucosamine transferase subunit ALG14 isoform 2-T2 [Guaruba guarouba]